MYKILIIIVSIVILTLFIHFNILRYLKINIIPVTSRLTYKNLPRVNSNTKVIVCFTTTQKRIDKCIYTIDSILSQTVKVDEIRIHIPMGYIIPYWLKMLERSIPEFKIIICEKDWGPATKLIPVLIDKTIPINSRIIYIDDDMIYNKNMIQILIKYSNIYPSYAICNKGWNVDKYPENKYRLFFNYMKGCSLPCVDTSFTYVDIVQGFSGVLVRPYFFNVDTLISYKECPLESFYVDDVYISGMLSDRNIKRISTGIPSGIPYIKELLNEILKNPTSLATIHNNDKKNDRVVANHFKWKKQTFFNLNK
jgi:hypothetical protein